MSDDRAIGIYWTAEEHALLLALRSEGRAWPEIAVVIGRSKSSCESRYSNYREGGGFRTTERQRKSAVAAAQQRVIAIEHTSLTSAFFGDPLPGRSALDKRRVEPQVRSISLAGGRL